MLWHLLPCVALVGLSHTSTKLSPVLGVYRCSLQPPARVALNVAMVSKQQPPPPPPDEPCRTANAADVFSGMKSPIPLDSPEGQQVMARIEQSVSGSVESAAMGAPSASPTALAADVFGSNMKTPIPVDSPEGQEALERMSQVAPSANGDRDGQDEVAPIAPPQAGLTGAKVRELLDAGLGEEQVSQLLAAEGVSPELIDGVLQEARSLPVARAPSPPLPAPSPAPPPPATVIKADEKLYPMPDVASQKNQIFLPMVPFGIARGAFVISSAVTVLICALLAYLLALTS